MHERQIKVAILLMSIYEITYKCTTSPNVRIPYTRLIRYFKKLQSTIVLKIFDNYSFEPVKIAINQPCNDPNMHNFTM